MTYDDFIKLRSTMLNEEYTLVMPRSRFDDILRSRDGISRSVI